VCTAFALILFTLIVNPLVAQWYLKRTSAAAAVSGAGDGD